MKNKDIINKNDEKEYVYVVFDGFAHIEGIFSTEKQAKEIHKTLRYLIVKPYIEKWEINSVKTCNEICERIK